MNPCWAAGARARNTAPKGRAIVDAVALASAFLSLQGRVSAAALSRAAEDGESRTLVSETPYDVGSPAACQEYREYRQGDPCPRMVCMYACLYEHVRLPGNGNGGGGTFHNNGMTGTRATIELRKAFEMCYNTTRTYSCVAETPRTRYDERIREAFP